MPTHAPQTTLYRVLYVHPYCTSYCIQNQRTESVMESPLWKWILIDSVKKPFYPGLAFAFSTYHLVASLGRVLLGLASLVFWCTYVRSAYFERRTLVFCDLLEFWEFTPLCTEYFVCITVICILVSTINIHIPESMGYQVAYELLGYGVYGFNRLIYCMDLSTSIIP